MSLNICLPLSALLSATSPDAASSDSWVLYAKLSALVFLEFAAWGAWVPVMARRLMGPLKMNGKQVSVIFATWPLANLISPLLFGLLADQGYCPVEYLLAGCHLVGAVAIFCAGRAKTFASMFIAMFTFSFFFGATLGQVNALVFARVPRDDALLLTIWAPIGWAAIGYALTAWRWLRREESDGTDAFNAGALMSLMLVLLCAFVLKEPSPAVASAAIVAKAAAPAATLAATIQPLLDALMMLREPYYLLFMVVSMIAPVVMQFYFMGTGAFMNDMGINDKNVPGAMALAQVAQAVATVTVLFWISAYGSDKLTLVVGLLCWCLLFGIYIIGKPRWLIFVSQALHGIAYVLFIMVGIAFMNQIAPPEIRNSAHQLLMLVENGIGCLFGSLIAGYVLDRSKVGGKIQWSKFWTVPLVAITAAAVLMAVAFYPPAAKATPAESKSAVTQSSAADTEAATEAPNADAAVPAP